MSECLNVADLKLAGGHVLILPGIWKKYSNILSFDVHCCARHDATFFDICAFYLLGEKLLTKNVFNDQKVSF